MKKYNVEICYEFQNGEIEIKTVENFRNYEEGESFIKIYDDSECVKLAVSKYSLIYMEISEYET